MNRQTEAPPAAVPVAAKQAGEAQSRWGWVEPEVWTERMLTALEQGVKGGSWFSLIDKVYAPENLRTAFQRVRANRGSAGVDQVTIERFAADLDAQLQRLSRELREQTYRPQGVKRVWIPKPGSREKRPLGIPTVRDRVVQTALRNVLEPIFERDFAAQSYGFRPGLGCKDALRRVQDLLDQGYCWVVDADLQGYFDSLPHEPLMRRVAQKVSDGRILSLLRNYLKQEVMDGLERWTPETGSPQGAVISPLLSNIYLDPLDWLLERAGYQMVRYADDFVVLCRTPEEAERALVLIREWVGQAELRLHPDKTQLVDAGLPGGFDFLGYHFERGYRWPRKKSQAKLKDALRPKTKRTNGNSLVTIIATINPILRGWFEYFKHSHKTTFRPLDGWVRMRLRSVLRKRIGLKGCGRGADHQRWPNHFFTAQGLFSLDAAFQLARQPALR